MKPLKVSSSLNLHYFPKSNNSPDETCQYIRAGLEFNKRMGFEAATLDLDETILLNDNGWQPYAENVLKDSLDVGLEIKTVHLPFSGGGIQKNAEQLAILNEKIMRGIDFTKLLGADYAVLHPVVPTIQSTKYDRREQYDLVMANLSPVADHAIKQGVNIVIENMRITPHFIESHRYCQTPDELCEIADALGIGVCWDFGHANISGIRQSEGLKYVGKRLKVLHINDNKGFDDDHLLPFCGNVDWVDAMHGLTYTDFDGTFNFEIATKRIPEALRENFASYIIASAKELMGYIK